MNIPEQTYEITADQRQMILLALGFAIGSARDPVLRKVFLRLANEIGSLGPDFVPYQELTIEETHERPN